MAQSVFEKEYIISPDYCDAAAAMSPLAAFTIFQAMAAEHAEQIGVGGMAMAKRGEFWLTVHTRIDFFSARGLWIRSRRQRGPSNARTKHTAASEATA